MTEILGRVFEGEIVRERWRVKCMHVGIVYACGG